MKKLEECEYGYIGELTRYLYGNKQAMNLMQDKNIRQPVYQIYDWIERYENQKKESLNE